MAKVSKYGQWKYPGQDTIIPNANGSITMKGVPYPVFGVDDLGYSQMMMPGMDYQFPGNSVYEIPMMAYGGDISIPNLRRVKIKSLPKAQTTGELEQQARERDQNRQQARAWDPNELYGGMEEMLNYDPKTGEYKNWKGEVVRVETKPMVIGKPKGAPKKSKADVEREKAIKYDKQTQADPTLWLQEHPEYMLDANGNPVLRSIMEANAPADYLTAEQKNLQEQFIKERNADPLQQSLGALTAENPQTKAAAERYANTQLAENILQKNSRDKYATRAEWIESFTPQEKAIILGSNKSYEFDPSLYTQFARALQTEGNKNSLWQRNLDLTEEEKNAPISRMGLFSPLMYPMNLMTGALTGDFNDALSGYTPKPYFGDNGTMRDYYQPEAQAVGNMLWQTAFDPLNAVGIGLVEDLNLANGLQAANRNIKALSKSATNLAKMTPEIGAATLESVLKKFNPYLEGKAGLLSKQDPIAARFAFKPSFYLNAIDAEASRFGNLKYTGKNAVDTYKAFAESNLPLAQLRSMAERHGLYSTDPMSRQQIIDHFKDNVTLWNYYDNIPDTDPRKMEFQDALARYRGYSGMDDMARRLMVDRERALNGLDIPYMLSERNPDINNIFYDTFPEATDQKLEEVLNSAANIRKDNNGEIIRAKNITTPKGFNKLNTSEKFIGGSDLLGDGNQPGKVHTLVNDYIKNMVNAPDLNDYYKLTDDITNLFKESLYKSGYTEKEIDAIISDFKVHFENDIVQGVNYETSKNFNSINSIVESKGIVPEYALLSSLERLVKNVERFKTDPHLNIFTRAEAPNSSKNILNALRYTTNVRMEPYKLMIVKNLIDNASEAEKANIRRNLFSYYNYRSFTAPHSNSFDKGLQKGVEPLLDVLSNSFNKKLSASEIKDLKDVYRKEYDRLYSQYHKNDQASGYVGSPDDFHQSIISYMLDPNDVLSNHFSKHVGPSKDKAANLYKKLNSFSLDDLGLDDTNIIRRGRSALRTNNVFLPETKDKLIGEFGKSKENITNLFKTKQEPFSPSVEIIDKDIQPIELTHSLFAYKYKNQREMAIDVKNKLETGLNRADVGDVLTGALSTSKDSYGIQMDYLMRIHAANPDATEPVFLGFRPMNNMSFVNELDVLNKDELLNLVANKLNSSIKSTGVDFGFSNKFPYIDNTGQIQIPQWGLKKTKDVPISIKKKQLGGAQNSEVSLLSNRNAAFQNIITDDEMFEQGDFNLEIAQTGLPDDYNNFLAYSETAPENRRPDAGWQYGNPRQYDHYGMWDALGKPKDFNQALEMNPYWQPDPYDGMYHGFSTNPNTGVWLKSHIPGEYEPGNTAWMENLAFALSNDPNWGPKNQNLVYDPDLQRMRYINREQQGGLQKAQTMEDYFNTMFNFEDWDDEEFNGGLMADLKNMLNPPKQLKKEPIKMTSSTYKPSDEYVKELMFQENGVNKGLKNGRYYAYDSVEGGTPTIGYGHKLTEDEVKSKKYANGLSYDEVVNLMYSDLDRHAKVAKSSFESEFGKGSFDNLDPKLKDIVLDFSYTGTGIGEFPNFHKAVYNYSIGNPIQKKLAYEKMLANYKRNTDGRPLKSRNAYTEKVLTSLK